MRGDSGFDRSSHLDGSAASTPQGGVEDPAREVLRGSSSNGGWVRDIARLSQPSSSAAVAPDRQPAVGQSLALQFEAASAALDPDQQNMAPIISTSTSTPRPATHELPTVSSSLRFQGHIETGLPSILLMNRAPVAAETVSSVPIDKKPELDWLQMLSGSIAQVSYLGNSGPGITQPPASKASVVDNATGSSTGKRSRELDYALSPIAMAPEIIGALAQSTPSSVSQNHKLFHGALDSRESVRTSPSTSKSIDAPSLSTQISISRSSTHPAAHSHQARSRGFRSGPAPAYPFDVIGSSSYANDLGDDVDMEGTGNLSTNAPCANDVDAEQDKSSTAFIPNQIGASPNAEDIDGFMDIVDEEAIGGSATDGDEGMENNLPEAGPRPEDFVRYVKEQNYFRCLWPGCNRKFKRNWDCKVHVGSVHLEFYPYECPAVECGRRFASKGALNKHIKAVHQ